MSDIKIRTASSEDARALLDIYTPYVTNTAITYEYEVPTEEEFRGRITDTLSRYPYIVAEIDGQSVGYAYAGQLHARAAYDWSAELSIYVKTDLKRSGIGKALYTELENRLRMQHVINVYACIAAPDVEDEYLTRNSIEFHAHMGYRLVGEFKKCAYKFGRWYNMVYMEKYIGEHVADPKPVFDK